MARFDPLAVKWRQIIETAVAKLGRKLTDPERQFITSRGGYVALEMIQDTVRGASAAEVECYLNSERPNDRS